ncbi:MAG: B12-binding domain-containing radical SAM protein [Thaumarchaeota archaeon]|nr:MAG: B12-binding domain-containing radical SAM protein [Nitrososphaerota archaeon]
MRVLLISPPAQSVVKQVIGTAAPPLGLAYLASIARELGCDVKIIDSLAEDLTLRDIKAKITKFYPDVVGVTATTSMIYDAYDVAAVAKEVNPNAMVVIGGPHATFMASEILQECKNIDVVVRGEGELTFRELLMKLMKNDWDFRDVLGITYRVNDKARENPPRPLIQNLDYVPLPAYDLLPMDRYRIGKLKFGAIITSRGCPYTCVFCSSSLQFGKKWRGHSVDRVLEELRILRYEYGRQEIEFLDDTFTLNKKRVLAIAEKIIEEGLDITWSASSRVNTFSREVGSAMNRAGAHTIYFGIESGSERTLEFIDKRITKEQAMDAAKAAKESGLRALGSFIIGFPYETEEDIRATIKFSNKVGVDLAQFTIATPYPGTKLWDLAVKENLLLTRNWRKFTTVDVVMKNLYLTPEKIKKLFLWAYLNFYLNPKRALEDLIKNKGFILRRAVPTAFRFLKNSLLSLIKGRYVWIKTEESLETY